MSLPWRTRVSMAWRHPVTHLALSTSLLFAGMNLMAPNLTSIAKDFRFNAAERDQKLGGDINAAFYLLGAPVSLVHGYLADKYNRRNLFVVTLLCCQIPAMFTLIVTQYWELLLIRACTGIAIAGVIPLLFSLLGDLFSSEHRAAVSTLLGTCQGAGMLLGQVMAGMVGPTLGWRAPFVVLAVPAVFFAVMCLCA